MTSIIKNAEFTSDFTKQFKFSIQERKLAVSSLNTEISENKRKHFTCDACQDIVRSPMECSSCQNLVCNDCIEAKCPSCNKKKNYRQPNALVYRHLNLLTFNCENKDKDGADCTAQDAKDACYLDALHHADVCANQVTRCPYDCKWKLIHGSEL